MCAYIMSYLVWLSDFFLFRCDFACRSPCPSSLMLLSLRFSFVGLHDDFRAHEIWSLINVTTKSPS